MNKNSHILKDDKVDTLEKISKILCLDMDAFFASVEQASRPRLKGKAMAVVGKGERTIILASSYEARKMGVRTGQPLGIAKRFCPSLEIVKASNKKYTYISSQIAKFLKKINPTAKMYSVDEAFMDITEIDSISSEELAYKIKSWLMINYKITGSIGIGESYILAKMASDVRKPDGYYEVLPEHRLMFIDGFKLGEIWGIGEKTTAKLNNVGLFTPRDVRDFGLKSMSEKFGLNGEYIYLSCCGLDKPHNIRDNEPLKSISHSVTSPRDIFTISEALAYLLQLSEMVSTRARLRGYSGKVVTLSVRNQDFITQTRQRNIGFETSATHHIYDVVKRIFTESYNIEDKPVRLLGVGLSELKSNGAVLNNLEDMISGKGDQLNKLYNVIDDINQKYDNGLLRGSSLNIKYRRPQVISPAYDEDVIYE